ncbi:MAG: hypothetical protein M1819_002464 [Sarea resinae]|nr:MAG: hypothetical protein M1819_002464 [Sarea resinae]
MRIILTGGTGLVGGELLTQCIRNASITSIIALTRRPLAPAVTSHEKVENIIHDNFNEYPDQLLKKLAGAEACLWALGGNASAFKTKEEARLVTVDYTLSAARAFHTALRTNLPSSQTKPFRFVYCSGMLAEQDPDKFLWYPTGTLKTKGAAEKGLFDLARANPDSFEAYAVRPALILEKDPGFIPSVMKCLFPSIKVDVLAAAMVDVTLHGGEAHVLENPELLERGNAVIAKEGK